MRLSVLDLSPIVEGGSPGESLHNTLDLARHVERLGFHRFWVAEHHNMQGIASAATSVVIGHVAQGTSTIRVGAGGIMLPNHAPLIIAEQFGTLDALFPGRIDLGLGRAPGTDQMTAYALRRNLDGDVNAFPRDVVELREYFSDKEGRVQAVPGKGQGVPIWMLGSSLYGAQLAALLGMPYAFASHFAPQALDAALAMYRDRFEPSATLAEPYAMAGLSVVAADTPDEARFLRTSGQQSTLRLRTGQPGRLPPPVKDFETTLSPAERAMLNEGSDGLVVGDPDQVREGIDRFLERTGVDELMVTTHVFDHAARKRSFEIVADVAMQTALAS